MRNGDGRRFPVTEDLIPGCLRTRGDMLSAKSVSQVVKLHAITGCVRGFHFGEDQSTMSGSPMKHGWTM